MEVINRSRDVNLIHYNYISNTFKEYLLYGFLLSLCIFPAFSIIVYIRDKIDAINKQNLRMKLIEEKINTEITNCLQNINKKILSVERNAEIELSHFKHEVNEKILDFVITNENTLKKVGSINDILDQYVENTKKLLSFTQSNDIKYNEVIDRIEVQLCQHKDTYEDVMENILKLQNAMMVFQQNINTMSSDVEKQISNNDTIANKRIDNLHEEIEEKSLNLENKLMSFRQNFSDVQMQLSNNETIVNKNINGLYEEIRNISGGFNLIPITSGWQGFCDFHSEKMIFNCTMDSNGSLSQIHLSIDDIDNKLIYDISRCRIFIKGDILSGPFKFLEQFKKIKTLYFEFNGVVTDKSIPSEPKFILNKLFHKVTEITPSIEIYYRCKDINPTFSPEILKEFIKTNKYSSFHLEVENNFTKDPQSGNMRYISCPIADKIKEHCASNNIEFVSNIGI